jgi:hypothetical protein
MTEFFLQCIFSVFYITYTYIKNHISVRIKDILEISADLNPRDQKQ